MSIILGLESAIIKEEKRDQWDFRTHLGGDGNTAGQEMIGYKAEEIGAKTQRVVKGGVTSRGVISLKTGLEVMKVCNGDRMCGGEFKKKMNEKIKKGNRSHIKGSWLWMRPLAASEKWFLERRGLNNFEDRLQRACNLGS